MLQPKDSRYAKNQNGPGARFARSVVSSQLVTTQAQRKY